MATRSVSRSAALLAFLFTATRTRIVAADPRPATNYRCGHLLLAETKIVPLHPTSLPDAPDVPIGVNLRDRSCDLVHPPLGTTVFPGHIEAVVGAQSQERSEPGRFANSEPAPVLLAEPETMNEAFAPLGRTPLVAQVEHRFEGRRSAGVSWNVWTTLL